MRRCRSRSAAAAVSGTQAAATARGTPCHQPPNDAGEGQKKAEASPEDSVSARPGVATAVTAFTPAMLRHSA